jgi:integrase
MLPIAFRDWLSDISERFQAPIEYAAVPTIIAAGAIHRAVRNRKLNASAVPAIGKLKTNNQRLRDLTEEEGNRVLVAFPDSLRPLIVVAIRTGMRKGELNNLMWDDVDFVSGSIFVRTAKSGEGRRLSMSPTVHRTLAALWQLRRKRLSAKVVSHSDLNRLVFTAPRGGSLANLGRTWFAGLKRVGVEGLHFHDRDTPSPLAR